MRALFVDLQIFGICYLMRQLACSRTQKYRELRYQTQITSTLHDLRWDFTSKKYFFELNVRSNEPVIGLGFSDHGLTSNADFMISWLDSKSRRHFQDTWTDSYAIMHADVHQSYEVDDVKPLSGGGICIKFSRNRKSCDLQDYHIDTGTTHILMFTAPQLYSGPDMINTSAFNISITKVQILKSQLPVPLIPKDSRYIEITNKQVEVPNVETTYWCSVHKLPTMRVKNHIVKYEGLISGHSRHVVHHMEVYSCQTPAGVELPLYSGPCDNKPSSLERCNKVIGAWAMGADSFTYPEEAGIPVGDMVTGVYVVLEIHYHNPNLLKNIRDSSGIRFTVTSKLRKFDAAIMEIGVTYDPRGSIPPRQDKFYLEGICTEECSDKGLPPGGITVFASQLHTHLSGMRVRTMHIRNGIQLSDLNADKHYSPHFQEIRLLQQLVKVLPGDALITECEYSSWDRENVTLGGFAISEEMCVNYIHYYPKTNLEVCKSTTSNSAIQRFFTMMSYYMRAKTNAFKSVGDNFVSMNWNPVNSRLLQWFYDTMPVDAECKNSDGNFLPGHWSHLTKPRVWLSDRYNPVEEHECDEKEMERFFRTTQ